MTKDATDKRVCKPGRLSIGETSADMINQIRDLQ